MATPEFVLDLRADIGTKEIWLPSVSAVVLKHHDDAGAPLPEPQILLVRRSDNAQWTVTSGILEPGEDPAPAGIREIEEETSVIADPVRIAGVFAMPPMTYPNGDRCRFLVTVFECRWVRGEPRVNDDESTAADWFSLNQLPEDLSATQQRKIGWAVDTGAPTQFVR